MKLIMPSNMTEERRAAMAAYGAELINVPAGKMEMARDLALEMQVREALYLRTTLLSLNADKKHCLSVSRMSTYRPSNFSISG